MPVEIVFVFQGPFQNDLYLKAYPNYILDKWLPKFYNTDIINI